MSKKETAPEAPAKPKRAKRLSKKIEGSVVTITEHTTSTTTDYDFATLPDNIQALFGPFGMSSKLGDAAAGKKGEEAVAAINKVWDGLCAGNWTVRAPAAEKISKSSIMSNFESMPEGSDKEKARELLANLGIISA